MTSSATSTAAAAATETPSAGSAGAKRRRGRPVGSRSKVLTGDRALGPHHISFLRAWFQGLDLKVAWEHYMTFAVDSSDARVIESTRTALLRAVLAAGHQVDLSHPDLKLKADLDLITREPFTAETAPIPSLADWMAAECIQEDFFPEAELLQMYREHYGLDTVPEDGAQGPQKPDVSNQVRALNRVADLVVRAPSPGDRLALWLSPNLAEAIQAAGATTLEELVAMVNIYGYNWHNKVAGLGATRAHAITKWLSTLPFPNDQAAVRASALLPPQRQKLLQDAAGRDLAVPPRFAIGPLEQLRVPPELSGASGGFRCAGVNMLKAGNDLEAIWAWLSIIESPHTRRSYQKEVERFYLWCLFTLRKPLSAVDMHDCLAYRAFLSEIPAEWIQTGVLPKGHPGWRPFRGQLAPSSQKQALVIIQALYTTLEDKAYQVGNPMRSVVKKALLPSSEIDLTRSLTRVEWEYAIQFARRQPASPHQRRDVLLLELLSSSGLRLDELANATSDQLLLVDVDESDKPAWILPVTGKGGRKRDVLIHDDVKALLDAHHKEQEELGFLDRKAPSPALIGALDEQPPYWQLQEGQLVLVKPEKRQALSASGIYKALKRLFKRAARQAGDRVDGRRLEAASTHWLRHTFARQQLKEGVSLEVMRDALGHASLATTGVYSTSERSRIIRELRSARQVRLVE